MYLNIDLRDRVVPELLVFDCKTKRVCVVVLELGAFGSEDVREERELVWSKRVLPACARTIVFPVRTLQHRYQSSAPAGRGEMYLVIIRQISSIQPRSRRLSTSL